MKLENLAKADTTAGVVQENSQAVPRIPRIPMKPKQMGQIANKPIYETYKQKLKREHKEQEKLAKKVITDLFKASQQKRKDAANLLLFFSNNAQHSKFKVSADDYKNAAPVVNRI